MQNACWLLPARGAQVAVFDDGADVQAETLVGADGERLEVGRLEPGVEVDRSGDGWLLEEGIVVVPGSKLGEAAAEADCEGGVDVGLPFGERRARGRFDLVEGLEEAGLVELARGERECEVVPGAEVARRPVAQPGELAHLLGDFGAHLLGGVPCSAALGTVVTRPQDRGDRVVVDGLAVDATPERVERAVDLRLELDELGPEVGRDLMRARPVVEDFELAAIEGVVTVDRLRERVPHLAEDRDVAEGVAQGDVGRDPAPLVLIRDGGAGEPPRIVRRDLEWAETSGDGGEQGFDVGHRGVPTATGTRCAGSRG